MTGCFRPKNPHRPRHGQPHRRTAQRQTPPARQRYSSTLPRWNPRRSMGLPVQRRELSHKDVAALARRLPEPRFGHRVRRLQLPTSSKIVPRPAAIIRATFASRLTLTANDLRPAMIAAVEHAASIRNPEFDARQRARRSTWDTPRFLYSYDETADRRPRTAARTSPASNGIGRLSGKYVADR